MMHINAKLVQVIWVFTLTGLSDMFNRTTLTVFILLLITISTKAQITYPDTRLPADVPQLFAKGLISNELGNRDFTISPAGDEIFYTVKLVTSTIVYLRKQNGKWSQPVLAPFSGKYRDIEAVFSPDGQSVYFSSDRPVDVNTPKKDFDIWRTKRLGNGRYSEPENLGNVVNTAKNEFYPSVTKNGNLYFTVEAAYGKGDEDIVVCTYNGTGYNKPESLSEGINTKYGEFNAFVDPDEQFILFSSYGRLDDIGKGDLYMSKKDKDGKWLTAKHLPAPLNSIALDYCPYVTPDKKYLIFTSNRLSKEMADTKQKTYSEIKALLSQAGNGADDIYWVKFNPNW
jgi:hypothetical protein